MIFNKIMLILLSCIWYFITGGDVGYICGTIFLAASFIVPHDKES